MCLWIFKHFSIFQASIGPQFDVDSITPPETGRPVAVPVNCGAKEGIANVSLTIHKQIMLLRMTV